jgi:hypothetical protein
MAGRCSWLRVVVWCALPGSARTAFVDVAALGVSRAVYLWGSPAALCCHTAEQTCVCCCECWCCEGCAACCGAVGAATAEARGVTDAAPCRVWCVGRR